MRARLGRQAVEHVLPSVNRAGSAAERFPIASPAARRAILGSAMAFIEAERPLLYRRLQPAPSHCAGSCRAVSTERVLINGNDVRAKPLYRSPQPRRCCAR